MGLGLGLIGCATERPREALANRDDDKADNDGPAAAIDEAK